MAMRTIYLRPHERGETEFDVLRLRLAEVVKAMGFSNVVFSRLHNSSQAVVMVSGISEVGLINVLLRVRERASHKGEQSP